MQLAAIISAGRAILNGCECAFDLVPLTNFLQQLTNSN